jgi:para-aminobenzoate synthetase component 1
LGYDLAWEIEQLPYLKQDTLPFPVAYWYEPECFAVLDHWEQTLWLAASDCNELDVLESRLEGGEGGQGGHGGQGGQGGHGGQGEFLQSKIQNLKSKITLAPDFLTSQEDYEAAVGCAKKYIQSGDIFQANLSLRFEAYTPASSWTIYQALQQINPSPFASYWQTPWGAMISCSPERLVNLQKSQDGNHVSTRPIAGTRSRGATPQQDRQLAQELLNNVKERSEHIMLVDLERNDLGRVCEWGSVAVNELLTIERYSHVMHLVSNITGTLRPEYNAIDLIRAVFPGGTITGCPKVRCMQIIEELELLRRSLFYGSCGYLDWRGNLDLNILIRTLLYRSEEPGARSEELRGGLGGLGGLGRQGGQEDNSDLNTVWGQVGAGIVADSDPEKEWYESLHKAQAQLTALQNSD